ncbi:MAG: MutS-related protein [Planctomycetota bacterium]
MAQLDAIELDYRSRIEQAATVRRQLTQADRYWNAARGIASLLLLVAGIGWYIGALPGWSLLPLGLLVIWLAQRHERLLENLTQAQHRQRFYEQQLARRQRRWSEVAIPPVDHGANPAVARDLDLDGPRSIFHWLSLAQTPLGRDTLRHWLLPADREGASSAEFTATITARQHVVQRLAQEDQWRETLCLHASRLGEGATNGRAFLEWATGSTWLGARPRLLTAVRLLSVLMLLILITGAIGLTLQLVSWPLIAAVAIPLLLVHFLICFLYTGSIHEVFDRVSRRGDEVGHYLSMLQVALQLPAQVGTLPLGKSDLREVAAAGLQQLATLHQLMVVANLRRAGLLSLLALILNWLFLWEFHLLALVERWQRREGRHVADWLTAIGTLEALTSLATVAHDEPTWCFPTIDPHGKKLVAHGLGHPLLPQQVRVTNDVELGPPGTFLLVTGSNMSGKSTLLRAVGVNVLLAQAGGPVCAQQLTLPYLDVRTSMRVADSLADGQSFFFAELLRLKEVVDHARQATADGPLVLYLLDEILQGTNSAERRMAVVEILRHLLQQSAIGAISTHDLELAECPELSQQCQLTHFRESLGDSHNPRSMTFDYRMRPGLSPTTNALILLELVGLRQPR